jgi:hypothetical protein
MMILMLPTIWLPVVLMVTFLLSGFWIGYSKTKYVVVGWSFLIIGFLLGLVLAGARSAIVPGDYAGWSGFDIFLDQMKFASAGGATLVLGGLACLFCRNKLAKYGGS